MKMSRPILQSETKRQPILRRTEATNQLGLERPKLIDGESHGQTEASPPNQTAPNDRQFSTPAGL
jgi:hypothetical protein